MSLTRRSVLGGLAATGMSVAMGSAPAMPDPSSLPPDQRAEDEAWHARMMAALSYERVTVSGAEAFATWEKLKGAGRGWPVIIGNDESLERIASWFSRADPVVSGIEGMGLELRPIKDILSAASRLKFPDDLRTWWGAYEAEDLTAPTGDWPDKVEDAFSWPTVALDTLSDGFHDRVHILLIPAKFGWEVPAYLRWGDWNSCPPPEYHVSALRTWHADFGVELVGMSGDRIDLLASRRPRSREGAMRLARAQYGYCPDIVDQGVGTISALAAILMTSDRWSLWWD